MYISALIAIACNIFTFTANKPEKHTLLRVLSSVTTKWHEIRTFLKVDSDTLDRLLDSSFTDVVKISKMLKSWLDNEPTPVTWNNIIGAIEGPLQEKSLAIEICKFLGIKSVLSLNCDCNNVC